MTKKLPPLPRSLNAKMLYVSLLGVLLGMLLYFLTNALGQALIENVYMREENVAQRKAEIYSRFSSYVTRNQISGKDAAALAQWTAENDYVTVLLYDNGSRHRSFSGGKSIGAGGETVYDSAEYGRLYPLRFSDGIYLVAIVDSSREGQELLVNVTAVSVAASGFILLLLLYMNHLTRRIIALSKAAREVSTGQLEKDISAPGSDEVSTLARSMDEMRRSLIQQMGSESRAWQANTELLTAISHDIRTPMTSMIGYLGLLNDSDFSDIERCRQFSRSAYSKAMDLKDLTDELFKYFLVFGSAELKLDMERYDGRLLLEQLVSEAEFSLAEAGFRVQRMEFEGECSILADPLYLKRVMDNLVSNVMKYGDKAKRVVILSERKDRMLSLCISNSITHSLDRVESTKIGLRTCKRIMEQMQGSFSTETDGEHFAAELRIPAESKTEATV
ncbi:MAG: HAMP domain-containing protein [Candidatus Limivicinus sp.]